MASVCEISNSIKTLDQQSTCRKLPSAFDGKFYKYVAVESASGDLVTPKHVTSKEIEKSNRDSITTNILQDQFNKNITDFFIYSMIPLHLVDSLHFRKMFTVLNIDKLGLKVMNKTCLENHIDDMYVKIRRDMKTQLMHTKDVCIVTNIFYGRKRCLVTTCHWIDSDLKRQSFILACRPYHGHSIVMWGINNQNLERIAGVHDLKKLVTEEIFDLQLAPPNTDGSNEGDQLHVEDGIVVMSNFGPTGKIYVQLCPAYQLDRFTSETLSAEVIKKCQVLWDASEQPQYAKVFQEYLGLTLTRPYNDYYWEWYESLRQVLAIQTKCSRLYNELKLDDPLQEEDFVLIREFIKCFKPIAEAAEVLEEDRESFYGITLPCLLSLRKKLIRLTNENYEFKYYKHLPAKYLKLVEDMFIDYFNLTTDTAVKAAIASISHPRFKDKWFSCIDSLLHERIKIAFERAIAEEMTDTAEVQTVAAECNLNVSFFEFELDAYERKFNTQKPTPEILMNHYLADKQTDISMLHKHKEIKNVFVKYNTPLSIKSSVYKSFLYEAIMKIGSATQSEEMLEKMLVLNVM